MIQIALVLYIIGAIACFVGMVGLIIDAFRESFFWGLGCLLFSPVVLAFVIFHWEDAKKAFFIWLAGFVLILLAGVVFPERRLLQEAAQQQQQQQQEEEVQQVEDKKPSSLKTVAIALVVVIILGGIGVVTVKFLKNRSSGQTYYEQDEEYVSESEEDPFSEEIAELPTTESLIADLQNEDPMVRNYAAVNLGQTGDRHAIKPLAHALKDPDQGVRTAAKESLIQILLTALEDEDPHARASAAKALGQIAGKRGVKPLAKTLKDEDQTVRTAAGQGLAMIKKKLGPEEWSKITQKKA
ncbi:MAG: HEAT repeat domain-containing protein [Planctomycetota bacterium]|jgi:HEAT repeat protein